MTVSIVTPTNPCRVLVIGRAATVWDELAAARELSRFDALVVINVVGRDIKEPFDHWVSYHPELFRLWMEKRRVAGLPLYPQVKLWSGRSRSGKKLGYKLNLPLPFDHVEMWGGSSGLLATVVALRRLEATHVVLCGVPMMSTARMDDSTNWRLDEVTAYRGDWVKEAPRLTRVRSMSGWTQELLGAPTTEWLRTAPSLSLIHI